MTTKNNPEYFPSLSETHLKIFAQQVVTRFSHIPITQVALYHYANVFFPERVIPTKYAMVLTVNHTVILEECEAHYQTCFSLDEIRAILSTYEEFQITLGQRSTLREDPTTFFELSGGRSFSMLYKDGIAPTDYLYEWTFLLKLGNETFTPGVLKNDPHWLLYENRETHIRRLVHEAGSEVELLFDAVREVTFSGNNPDANETNWQDAALNCFDMHQQDLRFVKRVQLEDHNLYAFASGQEARDFKGGLLKKIIEENGFGKHSARKLAELHRQICQKK